jgi:hypothetical protein
MWEEEEEMPAYIARDWLNLNERKDGSKMSQKHWSMTCQAMIKEKIDPGR